MPGFFSRWFTALILPPCCNKIAPDEDRIIDHNNGKPRFFAGSVIVGKTSIPVHKDS